MTRRRKLPTVIITRTAIAYIRVSTDEDRQALGIEAQRAAIASWASKEGVQLLAEYVETVSGGAALPDRPVLLQALADVAGQHATFLVVQRLDRFSRDAVSAALAGAELARAGATLATADGPGEGDDPTGKLVRGILLHVFEFERAMIAVRIKAALAVKKSRGELTGSAPYGMRAVDGPLRSRRDGTQTPVKLLEPNPEEQKVIALIRELDAKGGTVRGIEAELASRGIVGRAGKPLTRDAVHQILQRVEPNPSGP